MVPTAAQQERKRPSRTGARLTARAYFQELFDESLVSTVPDLATLGHSDRFFEGLLRRIKTRVGSDPYDTVSSMPERSSNVPRSQAIAW